MKKLILLILLILSIIFCAFAIIKNNNYVRVENEKQYVENGNDVNKDTKDTKGGILSTIATLPVISYFFGSDSKDKEAVMDNEKQYVENGKQNVDKTPKAEQANSSKSGKKYGKKKGGSYGKVKTNNKLQNSISSGSVVGKKSKQKSVKVNQVNSDKNKTRSVVNKNVKIVNKSVKEENRFYGKVRVGVGYEYQKYAGDDVEYYKNRARIRRCYDTKRSNQAPVISLGYNLYYKLNNRFALLGGLETQLRYPVSGSNFVSYYTYYPVQKIKFGEYFRLNTKFGVKTNLNKKLDVETYGIIGMNIAFTHTLAYNSLETYISNTNVGFTTGLGADLVIVDKFIVGLEYRYGANKYKFGEPNFIKYEDGDLKMKTHSVLAKVGYQF